MKSSYWYRLEGIIPKLFGPPGPCVFSSGKVSKIICSGDSPHEHIWGDLALALGGRLNEVKLR